MTAQSEAISADLEAIRANYSLTDEQRQIVDHVDRVSREVLHPLIAERLRAHKKQLISNGARGWGEEDWVFPSTVGTPRRAGSMRKAMSTLSEMLELDFNITPSVLRRTFNTLLEAANVDKLVLWSQLGHSSDAMTKHYSYVHHDRKKEGVLRVFDPAELGT